MDNARKLVLGRFKHKIGLVTGNSKFDYRMTRRSSQKTYEPFPAEAYPTPERTFSYNGLSGRT